MNFDDKPRRHDLGGCTITLVNGGALKLDGGAMFGIIPKPLWLRGTPADEQNRIQLACNCLLVEWEGAGGRRVIVETGSGEKFGDKERQIFAIDTNWLLPSLTAIGVEPESISDVVVSHLHFDHGGGLTRFADGSGSIEAAVPTFPGVPVHVQRREFDDARANFGIMNITYREENFRAIDASDAWRFHDGDVRPLPGIRLIPTPGHTRGHQSVLIEGRDRSALFLGDVMPTRNHLGPPYNMAYDLFPMDNRETKRRILGMAAEQDWLIVLDHDPVSPFVRVVADGKYFRLEAVE